MTLQLDAPRLVDWRVSRRPMNARHHKGTKMEDKAIEKEMQDKGLTAPRLTPQDIERAVAGEEYAVFSGRLTVCVLTLQNGFLVTGESSCVSIENFDAELGRKIARDNAKRKVRELEGYALRQRLAP